MHQLLKWWYFTVLGWKVEGAYPYHLKKCVVIVAPHTHQNDFFLGVAFRKLLHLEFVRFLGKKELFIPPFSRVYIVTGKQFFFAQKTPTQPIENPAKAGPITAAICQVELLHVAALGCSFLGIINPNKLKTEGIKKARITPPIKTKT